MFTHHALALIDRMVDARIRELKVEEAKAETYGESWDSFDVEGEPSAADKRHELKGLEEAARAIGAELNGCRIDEHAAFVSEYRVDRCYGGAEEGGWWYDEYEFVRVVDVVSDRDAAVSAVREWNKEHKATRYSVLGGADVVHVVEEYPGESRTWVRPVYC